MIDTTLSNEDILDFVFESSDLGETTIRQYFQELLIALWREREGFSGKHPFGNSGWENDIYKALIECKVVEGSFYEDGYIKDCGYEGADEVIAELILEM